MHCKGCDKLLSDWEVKKKDKHGVYLDLCNICISYTKEDISPSNEPILVDLIADWGDEDDI